MADKMEFPKTMREFIDNYSFKDIEEVYTNGAELVPVFRVEQAFEHYEKEIRNKAIDDFVIAIICELKNKHTDMPIVDIFGNREKWREKNSQYLEFENLAYKIAEQLKVGGENEQSI